MDLEVYMETRRQVLTGEFNIFKNKQTIEKIDRPVLEFINKLEPFILDTLDNFAKEIERIKRGDT